MTKKSVFMILAAAAALAPAAAGAQSAAPAAAPAANDPYKAYLPDPTHIPFILPKDIPWTGTAGKEQQYNVWGDPRKPGPYLLLLKWWPGNFSKPHFHTQPRFVVVVSGTWWVSSSNHYDPTKTYPLPAGSIVTDMLNTVHWDGAKEGGEPTVLAIAGEGPVPNVAVDENGKPSGNNNF
jgi:hypothetical protein